MDTAALVISIFAIVLSVVVAGWAIYLQWCMFKATTDQLMAIGRENASLAERIAMSLGELHESATSTRSRLDATMGQLVTGLLGGVGREPERAGALREEVGGQDDTWRVDRAASALGAARGARVMLEYLAGGFRDVETTRVGLFALRPAGWDEQEWLMEVAGVVSVLVALELLGYDEDKDVVWLSDAAKRLATRLPEVTHD